MNMHIQNSYEKHHIGRLYVVPTPIGNLDDMTFRAVNVLKEVNIIAAEDTRHTRKLLNHFSINNETISYHEHNRRERIPVLMEKLKNGEQIALVSDAGMPAISDPGHELVVEAINNHHPVIVLPGANAAIAALVGSGLPTDQFKFYGFLPRKKREREEVLAHLKGDQATLIFYESPHRIAQTLQAMAQQLGDRNVVIARELTKVYEQFIRGSISEILDFVKNNPLRGECVIVVEGTNNGFSTEKEALWWANLTIEEHVHYYETNKNISHKEAMKLVAKDRSISRRDVYNELHVKKNE